MHLDRLFNRPFRHLSKAVAKVTPVEGQGADDVPRGSGSWANEWAGSRAAVERARSFATRGKARKAPTAHAAADVISEGSVHTRPLLSTKDMTLYNWITDRLEADSPCCALHASVSVGAFLASDDTNPEYDPLAGLSVPFLVTDGQGHPICALVREDGGDPSRHLRLLDALLDADLPIVDLEPRPSPSALWKAISDTLPQD